MKLICLTLPNNTFVKKYGEVNDVFVNTEKRFAFVKFDYKANADRFRIAEGRNVVYCNERWQRKIIWEIKKRNSLKKTKEMLELVKLIF